MDTEKYFRVLKYEKTGQVKTDLLLESLADSTIEKKKLGFDRMGAPDLEILRRKIDKNERFIISVFNKKLPEIGSLVNSDYIKEQATRAFFIELQAFQESLFVLSARFSTTKQTASSHPIADPISRHRSS